MILLKKTTNRFISFRAKLVILLLVMLLPFVGFSIYKAIDINNQLEEEYKEKSLNSAKSVARSVDDYIASTGDLLISISKNECARAQNYPAIQKWFTQLGPEYPFYVNIIFVDQKGDIKVAVKDSRKGSKKGTVNVSDTAYYERAVRAKGIVVGDFMYGKLTGKPVVHVACPVFDFEGRRVGFVAASLDLAKIQDKIMQEGSNHYMTIAVVDNRGIIVARNRGAEKWVGKKFHDMSLFYSMLGKTSGTGKMMSNNTSRVFGFAATSRVPWFIRVGVDTGHIQSRVKGQLMNHFMIFIPLLLIAFAGWFWIGRDVDKLHAETERLSLIDPLTALHNCRKLYVDFEREFNIAVRYRENLSFLMLDIDHFKHYNDHNGHQAGDKALQIAADVIKSAIRDTDSVYRYGGEEFCVILPRTDSDEALNVAERIRSAFEDTIFTGEETQPLGKVTISIGVAAYPTDAVLKEELVKRADTALYRAKENGRNKVELFSNGDPSFKAAGFHDLGQCI